MFFFKVLNKIPFGDVSKIKFRNLNSFNRSLPSPLVDFKENIKIYTYLTYFKH